MSLLTVVGGVVTAVVAIAGLEFLSSHLSQTACIPEPKASTSQTAASDGATTAGDESEEIVPTESVRG